MAFEMTLASVKNPGQTFYSEIHVCGQIPLLNNFYY